MRKISKAVAAAGLAATVVVTGLSFGSAAATAAPASAPMSNKADDTIVGKIVVQDGDKWLYNAPFPSVAQTFEEAWSKAAPVNITPEADGAYSMKVAQGNAAGYCLAPQYSGADMRMGTGVGTTNCPTFTYADGVVSFGKNHIEPGSYYDAGWGGLAIPVGTGPAAQVRLFNFHGAVKAGSVDVPNRSAVLEGYAEPGTQVIINDSIPVTVAADGSWSKQLSNLKLGKQGVKVEQWKDGQQVGDTLSVDVDLSIAPLNVEHFFSQNVDDRVKVFGTADKAANVIVRTADGKKNTVPVGTDGTWEMLLGAPNKGGDASITVAQELPKNSGGSDETTPVEYTINYGAGVTVVSPPDDFEHGGGPLEMSGRGQVGSKVMITEKDKPAQIVGVTDVLANGTWHLETAALDSDEHVLVATQKSKGQNTTTAEITINKGASSELSPVSLDGPATVTPGKENTFTGKATPGATYTVVNAAGTQIVPGTLTVNDEGHWVFKRVVSNGATKFDFKIKQSKGNLIGESQLFSVKAATSQLAPITVATTSVNPGKSNTFTGTGEPGASYRVLNASGTQIVPGNLTIDAAGKWSFERVVSTGATKLDFKIEQTKGGVTATSGMFSIKAATSMPVTVTTKSITAGVNNTFEGTATPGATYRVLNVSGTQIVPGTHTVDSNGDWKFERVVSAGATELRFKIEQTKGGVTTTSELFTIPAK